jgi:hypothetical protein
MNAPLPECTVIVLVPVGYTNAINGITDRIPAAFRNQNIPGLLNIVATPDPQSILSTIDRSAPAESDIIIVTDSLHSDYCEILPLLYNGILSGYDIVIGSRSAKRPENAPVSPGEKVSNIIHSLPSVLLLPDIRDSMSPVFAVRRSALPAQGRSGSGPNFLLDVLGRGNWKKSREIPIESPQLERPGGYKLLSVVLQVIRLSIYALMHRESAVGGEFGKILRFATVGATGAIVNWAAYFIITRYSLSPGILSIRPCSSDWIFRF